MAENINKESNDPIVTALQDRLTAQSEAVSSASSGVEKAISGAIESTREGTRFESARIESEFGRAIGFEAGTGRDRVQNFVESRGGFATQLTGLRRLVETTDKNLNDLEQRKQELILQNNSLGAAKISELQIKELEFKQKSEQQVFENLLAESSFGLQAATFEEGKKQFDLTFEHEGEKFQLQKDQQSFTEQSAIGAIALEFGLQAKENDTISDIINRAQATGIVDERRAAELRQIEASINASNAQAAKALRKDPSERAFDPLTAEILAKAYISGDTTFLAGLKTNEQYAAVIGRVDELQTEEKSGLEEVAANASSERDFLDTIDKMTAGAPKAEADRILRVAAGVAANTTFSGDGLAGSNFNFLGTPTEGTPPGLPSFEQLKSFLQGFSPTSR